MGKIMFFYQYHIKGRRETLNDFGDEAPVYQLLREKRYGTCLRTERWFGRNSLWLSQNFGGCFSGSSELCGFQGCKHVIAYATWKIKDKGGSWRCWKVDPNKNIDFNLNGLSNKYNQVSPCERRECPFGWLD